MIQKLHYSSIPDCLPLLSAFFLVECWFSALFQFGTTNRTIFLNLSVKIEASEQWERRCWGEVQLANHHGMSLVLMKEWPSLSPSCSCVWVVRGLEGQAEGCRESPAPLPSPSLKHFSRLNSAASCGGDVTRKPLHKVRLELCQSHLVLTSSCHMPGVWEDSPLLSLGWTGWEVLK